MYDRRCMQGLATGSLLTGRTLVVLPSRAIQRLRTRSLAAARPQQSNITVQQAKEALLAVEEEHTNVLDRARQQWRRCDRLVEKAKSLVAEAQRLLDAGDDAAARHCLQEKAIVLKAVAKAEQRKAACLSLALKLEDVIGQRQSELIVLMREEGSLSVGNSSAQDSMQRGEAPTRGLSEYEIKTSFLELERQTLEQSLRATADNAQAPASAAPTCSADAEQPRIPGSWWTAGERHIDILETVAVDASAAAKQLRSLLARIVNARSRGRDPDAQSLVDLARLSLAAKHGDHGDTSIRQLHPLNVRAAVLRGFADVCIQALASANLQDTFPGGTEPELQACLVTLARWLQLRPEQATECVDALVLVHIKRVVMDFLAASRRGSRHGEAAAAAATAAEALQRVLSVLAPSRGAAGLHALRTTVAAMADERELAPLSACLERLPEGEARRVLAVLTAL